MSAAELYETRFAAAAGGGGKNDVEVALRLAAERLQTQAAALVTLGFEGALEAVNAVNTTGQVPLRNGFPKPPPCCAMEAVPPEEQAQRGRPYRCAPGGDATLPADYKYPT
jgi:hypothetical protein